jgi:hypothetical protein
MWFLLPLQGGPSGIPCRWKQKTSPVFGNCIPMFMAINIPADWTIPNVLLAGKDLRKIVCSGEKNI